MGFFIWHILCMNLHQQMNQLWRNAVHKLLTVFLMIALLFSFFSNDKLGSSFLKDYLNRVERNEYFRVLSLKYYGTTQYYKELALINQVAKFDQNVSESDFIIPTQESIIRLHENFDMALADSMLQLDDDEKSNPSKTTGKLTVDNFKK